MMSLEMQLEAKEKELVTLQRQFDDFLDSSKEMEAELEKSLNDLQSKYDELLRKKSVTDDKLNQFQEKNGQLSRDNSKLSAELVKVRFGHRNCSYLAIQ